MACKVTDLLRVSPSMDVRDQAEACVRLNQGTLQRMLRHPLTDQQWVQATSPIRSGGLGFQDAVAAHLPARLALLVDFLTRAPTLLRLPADAPLQPRDLGAALVAATAILGPVAPLHGWVANPLTVRADEPTWKKQAWWTDRFVRHQADALLAGMSVRDRVRFSSQREPKAGCWLSAVPNAQEGTLIESSAFRPALKWWLGMT